MLNRPRFWLHRLFRVSSVLIFAALTVACRTEVPAPVVKKPEAVRSVLNSSPQPIGVLYRLDPSDVEFAILVAIADPPQVPALEPGQPITDDLLPVVLGDPPTARRAGHSWSFVKREPGLIHASFERDSIRMLVAIMFDKQLVMLRIVDSRNLGQQDDHIDSRAFNLLVDLDGRIRQNIEAVAQRNWYGTPVPASR